MSKRQRAAAVAAVVVAVAILAAGAARAEGGRVNPVSLFWNDQEQAVDKVLTHFRHGAPAAAWGEALRDLVSAESGLLAYGVSFRDERLYGPLAVGLAPGQHHVLGWRIFGRRLGRLGFPVEPAAMTFTGQRIQVQRRYADGGLAEVGF